MNIGLGVRVVLSVLVCVVLTGCGGSAMPDAATSGPSKVTYIKRADALSKAQQTAVPPMSIGAALTSHGVVTTSFPSAARSGQMEVHLEQKDLMKLRALPEPAADRGALAAIWAARRAFLAVGVKMMRLFAANPNPSASAASRMYHLGMAAGHAGDRYMRLARRFGFKVC